MITAAIEKRLASLEFAAKHGKRSKQSPVEDVRQALQSVDGQADLGALPGENLWDTMVRRLQPIDGWNLDQIPGDTLADKIKTVDNAANTGVSISPEVRHAARHWFKMVEGV